MITVEVHCPQGPIPAIGFVCDGETTVILHFGGGTWTPVGAIQSGSSEVRKLPRSFLLWPAVYEELMQRLELANFWKTQTGKSGTATFTPVHVIECEAVHV